MVYCLFPRVSGCKQLPEIPIREAKNTKLLTLSDNRRITAQFLAVDRDRIDPLESHVQCHWLEFKLFTQVPRFTQDFLKVQSLFAMLIEMLN